MANGDGVGAQPRENTQYNSEQAAYWHAVISDLDDAVIRYTPDLVCKWCNASYGRLVGRDPAWLINRPISEFLDAGKVEIARERVQTLLTMGSVKAVEIQWELPDGAGKRWWSWNAQIVRSPLTGEMELQSVGRDIQALKERETALQHAMVRLATQTDDMARLLRELKTAKFDAETANAAKSRFLASMSHELRTPLNAIIGFADIMRLGVFGPIGSEAYREYIDDIWQSGKHLLDVISELLDLSRIETGLRRMTLVEIDPLELARETLTKMPPRQGAGIELGVTGTESCGTFTADRVAVRQAAINLLYNALKFTPAQGKVWLAFRRFDDRVELEVGDTGPGLTAGQIDGLLAATGGIDDDSLVRRKGRGAGLGIPIAKSLAEAHGGTLRFESKPGEGTRAILTFPQPPVMPGTRL
ncbi:PAS domain-containing sensor histidine kinase [Dongia sp.]|uniref:sensor histidine kinase n=1 Tax=Dongia sp. TaxID=1977262 RepID=UPI0037518B68